MNDPDFDIDVVSLRPAGQPSGATDVRTVEYTTRRILGWLVGSYTVALVAMGLGDLLPAVVRVPPIVLAVSFVPGALLVLLLVSDPPLDLKRLLYAYGASLLLVMAVGAVANITLPLVGVKRPLMLGPMAAAITLLVAVLAALVYLARSDEMVRIDVPPLFEPAPLGFLSLPLLAILGVMIINRTGNNTLLLLVLLAIAVAPLIVIRYVGNEWYGLGIWSLALAILYHKSLWQFSGFGGRPHGIEIWEAGRWSPGVVEIESVSSELLANGLLFPLLARLTDVFILTQYEVVNPFLVSFIPVAIFVAARRYVDPDMAFLSAAIFAFAHPFYLQYPTAGRAASPVIFLALFAVALTDDDHPLVIQSLMAVLFSVGIVVSHYGTSYYVMAALFLAVVVLIGFRLVDERLPDRFRHESVPDGGVSLADDKPSKDGVRQSVLSPILVAYYATATLAWYIYMRGGWKFDLLPKHIVENLRQLTQGPTVSGRSAARLQKNYGTLSIELAKDIYLALGALMALGFIVVLYQRFGRKERVVDDQYLAVAGSLFAIFGTTMILRNWGGGRPMMITFVFTVVFATFGVAWLANNTLGHSGPEALAVILAVLFVLNSGIAAATVLGGFAPSNVPLQSQLEESKHPNSQLTVHRETDIATHVWIVEHRSGYDVYADTFGARQFDWYRPDVVAGTPPDVGGYGKKHPDVFTPKSGQIPAGYVLILGHNDALEYVWPHRFEQGIPIDHLELSQRSIIYSNGESRIYFSTNATNTSTTNESSG